MIIPQDCPVCGAEVTVIPIEMSRISITVRCPECDHEWTEAMGARGRAAPEEPPDD